MWDAAEGSSSMNENTNDIRNLENIEADSNEASRALKQRLKGTRIKKRLKKVDKKEAHDDNDGSDLEDKDYTCKVCGIVCDNGLDHTTHLEKQHGIGKANTCPL